MFVLPHSVRPRRVSETIFENFFMLSLIVNVAGFVICFADFYDRQKNTFEAYFGNVNFAFSSPLAIIFSNCTYTETVELGTVTATSSITAATAPAGFLTMANLLLTIFILHGIFILLQAMSLSLFGSNTRHFRFGGSFIPIMTFLPCINVMLCIAIIALIWGSATTRDFYNHFVGFCATEYIALNQDSFLEAEYDTNVVFGLNLDWIFAPVIAYLAFIVFGVLHHLAEGTRPGYVALAISQFPWEQGFTCRCSKTKLAEWTRRRARLMEELEKGNLMPVSPFPQFATSTGAAFVPLDQTVVSRNPPPPIGWGRRNVDPWGGSRADMAEFPQVDPDFDQDAEAYPHVGDGAPWGDLQEEPDFVNGDEMMGNPPALSGGDDGAEKKRHRKKHRRHHRQNGDESGEGAAGETNIGEYNENGHKRHRRHHHRNREGSGNVSGNDAA
jgi:hypothetical protein